MKSSISITLVFCCLLLSFQAFGQFSERSDDFNLWSELSVIKDLKNKWELDTEFAYRLNNNASDFNETFIEFILEKDLPNKFFVGFAPRFIFEEDGFAFRFYPYAKREFEFGRFGMTYRFRIDLDQKDVENLGQDWRYRMRNRLALNYNVPKIKLTPKVAVEIFNRSFFEELELNQVRYTLGLGYRFNKRWKISTDYMLQSEYNRSNPTDDYILRFKLQYTIPKNSQDAIDDVDSVINPGRKAKI